MNIKKICALLVSFFISLSVVADEIKFENNTELSFYIGMFDFSDDGKSSLVDFNTKMRI